MTRRTFRTLYRQLVPSWLQDPEQGAPLLFSLGAVLDAFAERARLGLVARFPAHAPDDALPLFSRDRRIVRGIGEAPDAFRARVISWLDDHRTRGNPFALMRQLRAYCNAEVRVRTVDARGNWYTLDRDGSLDVTLAAGNWDWDGADASRWARFWVLIYPTTGTPRLPWDEGPRWGDPGVTWGPDRTWGTTATPQQVADVRRIVRDWKPAGTTCVRIIIAFDDDSFDPTAGAGSPGMPAGTWGRWLNDDEPGRRARLASARYWKGTGGPRS